MVSKIAVGPFVLGLALLLGYEPLLWPHAILLEAIPTKNAIVTGPDITIRLRFNSRVDGPRSQISLVLPDRRVRTLPLEKQQARDVLSAKASGLKAGPHTVRWQVLAMDGHITRGEYAFNVR